jgi:hypothetical protein
MPFMLKFYPDARFVWPHRDPVRALASIVSIIGTLQHGRSDHPFKGGSFEYILNPENSAAGINMVIDQIEAGAIPRHQLHNMLYKDLVEATMPTLEAMYRDLGLALTAEGYQAMQNYLTANPRTARPAHKLETGSEASVARARQAFRRYQSYFNIPNE